MQVPGADYTKKFVPNANDAMTRIIIARTLKNKEKIGYVIQLMLKQPFWKEGLTYLCIWNGHQVQ